MDIKERGFPIPAPVYPGDLGLFMSENVPSFQTIKVNAHRVKKLKIVAILTNRDLQDCLNEAIEDFYYKNTDVIKRSLSEFSDTTAHEDSSKV